MHFALSQHHWMKEGTSARDMIFILLTLNNEVREQPLTTKELCPQNLVQHTQTHARTHSLKTPAAIV